jgi:hypothetical protein
MSLSYRIARGADVPPAVADDLLRLRLRNMRLKPETDPDVDRAIVARWLSRASWVAWAEDTAGVPRGMVTWKSFRWQHRRDDHPGILCEYMFFDREIRATAFVARCAFRVLSRVLRDARSAEVWIGGGGAYIQTCVSLAKHAGGVHYLGEPGVPDKARSFLERISREAEVSVSPEGLVTMRTQPHEVTAEWTRRNSALGAHQRYLALNPRWQEGLGVIVGAKVNAWSFLRSARVAARRLARSTTRAASARVEA